MAVLPSAAFFAIVILVVAGIVFAAYSYMQEGITSVRIEKKFIDVSKKGSHYVLLTDKGLFEIDRPWWKTFDASANPDLIYAHLKEGSTYKITYVGWRFDPAYWYPLVVKAEG